jgi:ribosomal protein S18 acetylase RimI-like enzyme
MVKHIFVQDRSSPFPINETVPIVLIAGLIEAVKAVPRLTKRFGPALAVRTVAKSAFPNRLFFFTPPKGSITSSGGLALGFCKFYAVEKEAVVIGTIETTPEHRGRGLATMTIKAAMNAMIARGYTRFYIDTQEGNVPMLRSIENLEFGPPTRSVEA